VSEEQKVEKNEKTATEKTTEQTGSKTPAKRKIKGSNRFAKWFREMRSELKKVVWPTPKQIVNNTFVALTVMAVSAIAIWLLDQVGLQIFQAILAIGR